MGLLIVAVDSSFDIADLAQTYLSASFWEKTCRVSSVNDMVSKVLRLAGSQKIEHLVISGHGGPRCQHVGCGKEKDDTGDRSLQLGTKDGIVVMGTLLGAAASAMPKLAGHFTSNGIITLDGCNVADEVTQYYSGDTSLPGFTVDGKDLLRAVSRVVGIGVQAGTFYQSALSPMPMGSLVQCNNDACTVVNKWYQPYWRGY